MSNRLSPKQVEATIGYAPDNKTAADLAYEAAMALIVRPFLAFDARPVKPDECTKRKQCHRSGAESPGTSHGRSRYEI